MFIGEYQHTLDAKGRMNIPSKFREKLGAVFYVAKGLDGCLFVFPLDEWGSIEAKLKQLPITKGTNRNFARIFYSGAAECTLDKQGRINIPANLRKYASLEKEAVVIGVGTRVEVWDQQRWDAYNDSGELSYNEMAEQMSELGI